MSESNKGVSGSLSHWETGRLKMQGYSWEPRGSPDSPQPLQSASHMITQCH